ncbi:COPII coat assembly protein SEC16 [Hondaea fermentalgiana]|uniref:Protein transport protein sec16 n=1 Tax=Hondaea fermentalgiana TaxID=2315210 RepID=A0A2R5GVE2_9STRA|nr:COPII coat assembly protein SEC16 [Hondaea fermentalgiana]|eukprot:GBG34535.1 COPII coat assembly protein SEC16 [Hondaea fermentalgiana]
MAQEGWLDESLDDGDFGDSVKADEVSSEKAASEHGKGEELMFPPSESDLATDDAATNHEASAKDEADFDARGALRADLSNGMNRMLDELAASHHQNIGETLSVVSRAATRGSTTSSLAGSILVGEDDRDGETDDEGDHMGTMPDPLGTPMLPPPPLSMDALSQAATKATSEGGDDIVDAIATEDRVLNREIFRNSMAGENPETLPENASITTNVHSDAPLDAMSMTYSNRGADLDLEGPQGAYQPLDGLDVASSAAVSVVSGVDELPPESVTPDVHGHPPSMHDTGPESTASPVNEESSMFAAVSHGAQGDSAMLDPERTSPIPQYNRSPQQHHDHYDPSQFSSQGRIASPEEAGTDFTAPSGDHTSAHGHAPLSHPMPMAHSDHDIPELSTSPSPPLSTRAHFPLDETRNEDSASMSSQHLPGHSVEDSTPFEGTADPCATSEAAPQSATSVVGSETYTSGVDAPTSQVPSPDAPSAPESIQNASAPTPPPDLPPQVDVETSPSGSGPFGAISPPPPPHDGAIVEDQPSQDSIGLFGTNTPPPTSQASAFDNSSYPSEYETQTASGTVEASFPSAPPMDSSHAKDSPLQNAQASFEASEQQPPQNTSFAPVEDTQSASELFGSSSSDMPPQGSPFDDAQPAQTSRSPFEASITPPPPPQDSSYAPEDAPQEVASGLFETSSPSAPPQGSPFDNSQPPQNAGGLFGASSPIAPPPQGSSFDEDQATPNAGGHFGASSPPPPPQDSSYVPEDEPHSASGLFGAPGPSAPPQGSPFDEDQAPQDAGGLFGAPSPSPPPQDSSYVPGEEPHSASGSFGASSPSAPPQGSSFDDAQPPQTAGGLFGASSPSPPPQDSSYVSEQEPHSASGLVGASSPSAPPQARTYQSKSLTVQVVSLELRLLLRRHKTPRLMMLSHHKTPVVSSELRPLLHLNKGAADLSEGGDATPQDGMFGASIPDEAAQDASNLFGAPSSPPSDNAFASSEVPHEAAMSSQAPGADVGGENLTSPSLEGDKEITSGSPLPKAPPQEGFGGLMPDVSPVQTSEEVQETSDLFGSGEEQSPAEPTASPGASPSASPGHGGGLFVDTPGEDVTGTAEGLFASPSKGDALAAGSPNTPNAEGLFGSSSSSDLFADGADDSANLFDRSPTKARASGQEAFGGEPSQFYQGHPQEVPQQHYQQSGYAPNQQQYPPSQYHQQDYAYQGQQQDQMYYQDQQSMPIDDARSRQGSLQSFGSGHYSQQNTFEAPAMQNSPQSHPSRRESVTSGASRMSQHTHMAFPQPQPMYPPSGDLGSDRFSQPSTGTVNTNTAQDYSQSQPDGVNPEDAQVYAMNTGGWEQDPQAPLGAAEAMSPGNEFSLSFQQDEPQQQSQQQQQDDQAGHHAGGLPDMRQLDPSLLAGRVVAPRRMSGSSNFSSATGTSRPLSSMPDNPIVGFGNIRRQDGRRPHALAIWGFGGRLVTMFPQRRRRLGSFTDQGLAGTRQAKSSSLGQESDAGKQTHENQAESLVQSKLRQGRVQIFSLADLAAVSPSAWLVDRQIRFPGPLVALPPGSAPVDHRLVADFLQREIDAHAPADNGAFVSKLLWQVIQLFLRGEGDLQGKDVLSDLLGVLRAPAPSTQTIQAEAKAEADGSQHAGETGTDVVDDDDDGAKKDKGDEGDKGEEDIASTVPAIPDSIAFKTSSNLSDEAARSAMMDIESMLEAGDREGAVVRAIESELWAQALIISNFVSVAAYRRVVERFVHATMPRNSQSHALFLLFAGLGEKALALDTEGASADNASPPLQDTWRRTLSAILANRTPGDTELITSLGDRLWSDLGDARAAHICYLAAGVPLNSTSGSRMILVGGDHKSCESHRLFVTPETIERTELYLYGLSSRHSFYRFDGFHPYRLVYAMWLADLGAVKQAYAWVRSIQEVIKARSPSKRSSSSSSVGGSPRRSGPFPHAFQRQLKIFADRLMTSEAKALGLPEQMQQSEDSSWIPLRLSSLWRKSSKHPGQQQVPSQDPLGGPPAGQAPTQWNPNGPRVDTGVNNNNNNNNNAPESGSAPQPPMMMPPAASSSGPFGHEPPSAMSSVGGGDQPAMAGGLPPLHPSGMGPGGEGNNSASGGQGNHAVGTPSLGGGSNNNNREESSVGSESAAQNQKKETMGSAKAKEGDEAKATEGGWGLTSWMKKVLPKSNVKKGTTGNKLDAYYDKKLGKWIFPGDDPNAGPTAPAAPPKMEELRPSSAPASGDGPAAPSGPPQYSAGVGFRRGNTKSRYVDSFAQSGLMSDTPRPDTAPGNSGLGAPPTPLQQMMMPPGASNPMMPPQIGSFPPGPSGLGGPGGGPPKFSVFKPPPAPVAEEPSAGDTDPAGPEAMDGDSAQAGDLAAQGGDGASEGPMAPPPPSQLSTPPPPAMAE